MKEENNMNEFGFGFKLAENASEKDGKIFDNMKKYINVIAAAAMGTVAITYKPYDEKESEKAIGDGERVANIIAQYGFHDCKLCLRRLNDYIQGVALRELGSKANYKKFMLNLTAIFIESIHTVCKENNIGIEELLGYKTLPKDVNVEAIFFYSKEEEENIFTTSKERERERKERLEARRKEEEKLQAELKAMEEARKARFEAEKAEAERLQAEKNAIEEEKRQAGIAKINERIFRIRKDMKDVEAFGLLVDGYDEFEKVLKGEEVKSHFNDDQIAECKKALKTVENSLENTIENCSEKPFYSFTRPDCRSKFQYVEIYPAINR